MANLFQALADVYGVASFMPPRRWRRLWRGSLHGWRAAARYRRLSMMSDEELARRGLDRASIGRHAFFADPPSEHD